MLRAGVAGIAVAALLFGFAVAPYTHAHTAIDSVSDERHPHGATLVHTHATPHSQQQESGHESPVRPDGDSHDEIWSVASFIFQQSARPDTPGPALILAGATPVEGSSTGAGVPGPEPSAHGPPVVSLAALRAPPIVPPASA